MRLRGHAEASSAQSVSRTHQPVAGTPIAHNDRRTLRAQREPAVHHPGAAPHRSLQSDPELRQPSNMLLHSMKSHNFSQQSCSVLHSSPAPLLTGARVRLGFIMKVRASSSVRIRVARLSGDRLQLITSCCCAGRPATSNGIRLLIVADLIPRSGTLARPPLRYLRLGV